MISLFKPLRLRRLLIGSLFFAFELIGLGLLHLELATGILFCRMGARFGAICRGYHAAFAPILYHIRKTLLSVLINYRVDGAWVVASYLVLNLAYLWRVEAILVVRVDILVVEVHREVYLVLRLINVMLLGVVTESR